MSAVPRIDDVAQPEPLVKADRSLRSDEELCAWDFIRTGLVFTLIVAAIIAVVSSLGRITSDTIPIALIILGLVSIAIWGGIGLVAVPTLVGQRVRRNWVQRRSKRRAGSPDLWDEWIDGPGSR